MKKKAFQRLIDTIFAAAPGEEMLCEAYFDALPGYADMEARGEDAAAQMPQVRHHMHQCPECEDVYLALREILAQNGASRR